MKTITFEVPGEVKGKGRARFVRATGRAYTPPETVSYENLVRMACRDAMERGEPLDGPIAVLINATFQPAPSTSKRRVADMLAGRLWPTKKPDIDQVAKVCLDAMNQVAFRDDAQVVSLLIGKSYGPKAGLIVTVSEYAPVTVAEGMAA